MKPDVRLEGAKSERDQLMERLSDRSAAHLKALCERGLAQWGAGFVLAPEDLRGQHLGDLGGRTRVADLRLSARHHASAPS